MVKAFSITDIGRKRKINQDTVFCEESGIGSLPNLFLVADGMGGHKAGDYASKYAIETIVTNIKNTDEKDPIVILKDSIQLANKTLRCKSCENEEFEGMGTTIVAVTYVNDRLIVANVGDSRLYVINDTIEQVTTDHSLVEEMVRLGGIDREQAKNHPDKNIITRALGVEEIVKIDFFERKFEENHIVLMCSDGLSNMIDDEEIFGILREERNLEQKAYTLIERANDNGGRDNIAIILVENIDCE